MPQVLVFLALSLALFFFNLIGSSNGKDEINSFNTICPSHQCANLNISYPFWHWPSESPATQYCGYQGFGVACESGEPILHIGEEEELQVFYVSHIDYSERTVSLVDSVARRNQSCPMAFRNLTFDALPLSYSQLDRNLSFYSNCKDEPVSVPPVVCLGSGVNRTYVFVEGMEPDGVDWQDHCEEKVMATVMERNLRRDDPNVSGWFGEAIGNGFVLKWGNMTGCEACEDSAGRCGFKITSMTSREVLCFCPDGSRRNDHCKVGRRNLGVKLGKGITAGVAAILALVTVIFCVQRKRILGFISSKKETINGQNVETFLKNYGPLAPKRYSYSDIKRMTNSFRGKLGKGGYGAVYKGKLSDGRLVAVKLLSESQGNGEEFINEVASISRTSHVHVVSLLGFCYQRNKRALVYEFMSNGSLDKFICYDGPLARNYLNLKAMCQIAVGVARGLEYLHRGCSTRIVHFDIKPHNILLDDDFCPKISDFGLAKLCQRKESIMSMLGARGTIGYIAPEVFCRNFGGVSHKSDVYSYGMMLLEMVGGRKENGGGEVNNSSEMYFPDCIYKLLENDEDLTCKHGNVSEEEKGIAKKMTLVGLWCIQTNPADRPSIGTVVEMLEGGIESLQIPPRPFLSSPARFIQESSLSSLS